MHTLSLAITRAFIPNLWINYWCGSSENLFWIPYQQSVFQCFDIMPRRSVTGYGVCLVWLNDGRGCFKKLLRIQYQKSVFQYLTLCLRSYYWLWSMVSMAECWYLLTLSLTITRAFIPNIWINYSWGTFENLL